MSVETLTASLNKVFSKHFNKLVEPFNSTMLKTVPLSVNLTVNTWGTEPMAGVIKKLTPSEPVYNTLLIGPTEVEVFLASTPEAQATFVEVRFDYLRITLERHKSSISSYGNHCGETFLDFVAAAYNPKTNVFELKFVSQYDPHVTYVGESK